MPPPSVAAGKFLLAVTNDGPILQLSVPGLYTSTSFEGLGALLPPPSTHTSLPIVNALVSAVSLGIFVMGVIVFATVSYLYEKSLSNSVVPSQSDPPAV